MLGALRAGGRLSAVRRVARALCTQLPELTTTKSGLMYRDVSTPEPEAPQPVTGDLVSVHYTGR